MLRMMMRAKIHGATLTGVHLHYVGSVTLDPELMEKVDIFPHEMVHVLNLNNGARLETYAIPGDRGSGVVALNGAAARLGAVGDKVLVVAYAAMTEEEARSYHPKIAIVDAQNRIVELRHEALAAASR